MEEENYEVPESDAGFNMILGIILLTLYIFLLIPLNIFMKKKFLLLIIIIFIEKGKRVDVQENNNE